MADAVTITITATNGASQVFKSIQTDAKSLGTSLDTVGSSATTAASGIDSAEASASTFGDTLDRAGVALTAVGAGLTYAGTQAMEHERLVISITNAYGDAADEMIAFADQLSGITIFSDEDILAGERFFATLRNNYGLTVEEIQKLMQTTADLASASGISFEDASNRVAAAIRGEGEAAEYLGLTMNQQAIDREGLTLTMTNQEAAQFRLNALFEQAAVYQGTASDVANSSIGTYASLTNQLQNLAVEVGDFIGPWGSLVSGFGTAAIGISGTLGAFGKLGSVLSTTKLATMALPLALNPLTLALGAAAIAGTALFIKFHDGAEYIQELDENIGGLAQTVDSLKLQGLDDAAANVEEFKTQVDAVREMNNTLFDPDKMSDDEYDAWLDDKIAKLEELGVPINEQQQALEDMFVLDDDQIAQFDQDIATISELLTNPLVDAEKLQAQLDAVYAEYDKTDNIVDYANALHEITTNTAEFRVEGDAATGTLAEMTREMAQAADGGKALADSLGAVTTQLETDTQAIRDFIEQARALGGMDDPLSSFNLAGLGDVTTMLADNLGTVTSALDNTYRIIVSNTDAMGQTAQATEEWVTALTDASEGVSQLQQLRAAGVITDTEYLTVLQAQQDILSANATVQQEILGIQATQAPVLASLVEQQAAYLQIVGDLSAEQQLVTLGWMDSATAAQAYTFVTQAAAAATGDFGAAGEEAFTRMVQGAVAANPVLGEMLEQMDLISIGADGTITVNYDSVSAAQSEMSRLTESIDALTLALGGVPPLHIEIDGSVVEVESVAAGVLLTMNSLDGLVSTIQLAAVDNASAPIAQVDAERQALDGTSATVTAYGINASALYALSAVQGARNALDGTSATVSVNAVDNASGILGGVAGLINSLNGAVATTYVQTVSLGTVGRTAFANGGTVWADQPPPSRWGGLAAANGRTVMVGEAGPELVTLPHGAQVMPHAASMSRVETSAPAGGDTYHIPITVQGSVYGIDDLAGALEGAINQRRRGYGVART